MNEDVELINGLGSIESDEEFLGKVKKNTKKVKSAMKSTAKKAASKTSTKVNVTATTASAASASGKEMGAMVSMLSNDLQEGLKNGSKQLVDATIYTVKALNGNKLRVFEDSDDKKIGVCNIAKAKLEKNEVFCLSAIQVLYGTTTSADTYGTNVDWGEIPSKLQAGEFTFRAGTQVLFDRFSTQVFKNHKVDRNITPATASLPSSESAVAFGQGEFGFYKLANPKLIRTQEALDMFVEWNDTIAPDNYAFVKVILYGTKIMSK